MLILNMMPAIRLKISWNRAKKRQGKLWKLHNKTPVLNIPQVNRFTVTGDSIMFGNETVILKRLSHFKARAGQGSPLCKTLLLKGYYHMDLGKLCRTVMKISVVHVTVFCSSLFFL